MAATAYLLDQTDLVRSLLAAQARVADAEKPPAPPLGRYRTFQVQVSALLVDTGMHAADLAAADVLQQIPAVARATESIELTSFDDIRLPE